MKKNISRMFLAVFMVVTFLCCLNMTAFAEQPVEFTGTEDNLSASVSTGNATVEVVVSEAQNTDIIAGDKLVVTDTGTSNSAGILSSNETEFVEVIAGGTMEVQDENGHEKVVRDSADVNHNNIPLDGDTDDDGCVTTYVTQKFSTGQLSGVMNANQTKDLIFKSQLANPGTNDKDPEVTYIQKDQIKAVAGGYTVTVSFDGIRDWIFGLVNHTVSVDYNLQKITSNEEMSKKVNQDINLLKQNLEDGAAMFKIPEGGAKIWIAGSKADYADSDKKAQMEANFAAAKADGTLPQNGVNGSTLTFDAINGASNRGPGDGFLGAVKQKGQGFDGCPGAVIGCESGAWKHGCSGGGVSYGENGLYYAYTYDHAELTEADLHLELKDKKANHYAPTGSKSFTKDDVELYFYGEDGQKITLGFFDFVDNYMSGASDDGTITVCFGGIYKTITLPEWAPSFYFNPYTVGGLIEKGYYSDFLFNENGNASVKVDFAMDANNADNNAIYVTAEPNADGKFEPTTMKFNPELFRHLGKAAVRTFSLTMGNEEVAIAYLEVAELMKKYNGAEFVMNFEPAADGLKVTATIFNKLGQQIDVTSELNIKVTTK